MARIALWMGVAVLLVTGLSACETGPEELGAPVVQSFDSIWVWHARCQKLHGQGYGWQSPTASSRDEAQAYARDHDRQYAGHHAQVKRQRRR